MPPTTFHLSPLLPSEIPLFAALDEAAMSGWPFADAMAQEAKLKNLGSRRELIEGMVREVFERNEKLGDGKGKEREVYLKVVEESSGRMVAAGSWRREERVGEKGKERKDGEGGEGGYGEERETVFGQMGKAWRSFREEWFCDEPVYHLVVLCTHPDWQRQGAGSLVVEWGCKKADEEGLKCALHASAAGLKVYTKHGFEVVKETEFDLRPFGVEGREVRRAMIRLPRGREGGM